MNIFLNGELIETAENCTISRLLELLELKNQRLAVEVNAEIVARSRFAEYCLQPQDKVEIVRAVGGG